MVCINIVYKKLRMFSWMIFRVRLSKRRKVAGSAPVPKSRLIVKHREPNENEVAMQVCKLFGCCLVIFWWIWNYITVINKRLFILFLDVPSHNLRCIVKSKNQRKKSHSYNLGSAQLSISFLANLVHWSCWNILNDRTLKFISKHVMLTY